MFRIGAAPPSRRCGPVTEQCRRATLSRFGVSPDSVTVSPRSSRSAGVTPFAIAADDRLSDNASGIVRLDYLTEGGQSISLRSDFRWSDTICRASGRCPFPRPAAATATGGRRRGDDHVELCRALPQRAQVLHVDRSARGYGRCSFSRRTRAGVVGARRRRLGIATLTFGGNTGVAQEAGPRHSRRPTNCPGSRTMATGSSSARCSTSRSSARTSRGTVGVPSRSTRWRISRPAGPRRSRAPSLRACARGRAQTRRCIWPTRGAFAGATADLWRARRGIPLRQDAGSSTRPWSRAFGYRTDEVPSDFQLSPRVGFTWTLGLPQQRPQAIAGQDARPAFQPGAFRAPSLIVRGGVGLFRSAPSTQLVAAAAGATGFPTTSLSSSASAAPCPWPIGRSM